MQRLLFDEAEQTEPGSKRRRAVAIHGVGVVDDGDGEVGETFEQQRRGSEDQFGVLAEVKTSGNEDVLAIREAFFLQIPATQVRHGAEEAWRHGVRHHPKTRPNLGKEVAEPVRGKL